MATSQATIEAQDKATIEAQDQMTQLMREQLQAIQGVASNLQKLVQHVETIASKVENLGLRQACQHLDPRGQLRLPRPV